MIPSTLKGLLILPAIFLAGCANDRYTPTTGDPKQVRAALHDCAYEVYHAYYMSRRNENLAAGVGPLAVIVAADADKNPMPQSELGPRVDACMAQKGYIGTSEN